MLMGTVILGIVGIIFLFLAMVVLRRRRARLSRQEQYISASGLRWLRTQQGYGWGAVASSCGDVT